LRVIFVCSGNYGISAIIKAQADSLKSAGIEVLIYPIVGKGFMGYLGNVLTLRHYLKTNKPDLVHAHYSLSGLVAMLSTRLPVIVSLMGSDVNQSPGMRALIRFCSRHIWKLTIVKSDNMKAKLGLSGVQVIPNGVNLELFRPLDRSECRRKLNWKKTKKHILFVSACDPNRPEKNLRLAEKAIRACNRQDIELHTVFNIEQTEMPVYLNASDLLLVTSKWEGSPNIVKEAMACNVPIVTTDVGDVRWLFGNTKGLFVASQDVYSVSEALRTALMVQDSIDGRKRIIELGLDSESVAMRLINVYKTHTSWWAPVNLLRRKSKILEITHKSHSNPDDMKLGIASSNDIDAGKWQNYVNQHKWGTIFHTPYFFNLYQNTPDHEPFAFFVIDENEQIRAMLSGYIQTVRPGLLQSISRRAVMMQSPLYDDTTALDELLDYYTDVMKSKAVYTEIRNHIDNSEVADIYLKNKFRFEEHLNILVDLTQGSENLWNSMVSTRRKQIQRGFRRGVEAEIVNKSDEASLLACYTILSDLYRKIKLPLPSYQFIHNAVLASDQKHFVLCYVLRHETEIIGFRMVLCYKDIIYDWFAASREEHYDKYPNDILPWEVMKWGAENGYRVFDFGGAGHPGKEYGVRDYKLKFGGSLVNYGRYHYIHSPIKMAIAETGFRLLQKFKR